MMEAPQIGPDPKIQQQFTEGLTDLRGAQSEQETAVAAKNAAIAPIRDKAAAALGGPMPQRPQTQAFPEPPQQQDMRPGDLTALAVFSALLPLAMRGDGVDAMNALSGGIQGLHQGRTDLAKQQFTEWHAKTEQVSKENARRLEEYNQILSDRSLSMQEQDMRMKIVAAKYDDQIALAGLKSGNRAKVLDYIQKANQQQVKFGEINARLSAQMTMEQKKHEDRISELERKDKLVKETGLQPEAYKLGAAMWVDGDHTVFSGMSRNKTAMTQAWKSIEEEAARRGWDSKRLNAAKAEFQAMTAAAKTAKTREVNIGFGIHEAQRMIPLAQAASDAVPRTNFVPANQLLQLARSKWSPEQIRFMEANEALITAFSSTMSRTGANTVHAQQRAAGMLNTAFTPEQYHDAVDQLMKEAEAALQASRDVQHDVTGAPGGTIHQGGEPHLAPLQFQDAEKERRYQEWKQKNAQ